MIQKIYKVIADKTLSFGCKFFHKGTGEIWRYSYIWKDKDMTKWIKIIWHPVMIWDVLEFSDKLDKKWKRYWYTLCNRIIDLWKDKRKPIDDQSEECIKFVHSLLQ